MSKNRTEELKEYGIDIKLTKVGQDILAQIIADGCPIKFVNENIHPIVCPYQLEQSSLPCKKCWKKWLKDFLMEGN